MSLLKSYILKKNPLFCQAVIKNDLDFAVSIQIPFKHLSICLRFKIF